MATSTEFPTQTEPPNPQSEDANTVQEPRSPPLPDRPIAVAPGPRATRLRELYASSLNHALGKISWENLATCYPTIAAGAPNLLRGVRKTMVERLEERCNNEFERILTNRSVVPKLNELETLISSASNRRQTAPPNEIPIPPHNLPPEKILQAHLSRPLAAHQSQLNARLQTTQSHNDQLFASILDQRREIESLLALLERSVADVDVAASLLVDEPDGRAGGSVAEELAREARAAEADVEMAGM